MRWRLTTPRFVIRLARRLCNYDELLAQYVTLYRMNTTRVDRVAPPLPGPPRPRTPHAFRPTSPLPPAPRPRRESVIFDPFNPTTASHESNHDV